MSHSRMPVKKQADIGHPFTVYPSTLLLLGCSTAEPESSSGRLVKISASIYKSPTIFDHFT